jgi:hypothetical protein
MRLFSICTASVHNIRDEFFLPTCPPDLEPWIVTLEDSRAYEWGSSVHETLVRAKVEYLADLARQNTGEIVLWADLDIQFFGPCADLIEHYMEGKDLAFQSELWPSCGTVSAGLIAVRCNSRSAAFFDTVKKLPFKADTFLDQGAMQSLLNQGFDIDWVILPHKFWAYSHGGLPPREILLHHANCEGVLSLKVEQMQAVRDYVRRPRRFPLAHRAIIFLLNNRYFMQRLLDIAPRSAMRRLRQFYLKVL